MKFTPNLTKTEWNRGMITMLLTFAVIPALLPGLLPHFSAAQMNFTVYFINAAAVCYVLRRFLLRNVQVTMTRLISTLYLSALGYLAQQVLSELLTILIYALVPAYVNLNNQHIAAQLSDQFGMMVITTVVLAPIAEECLFRGLLFRGIYDRSPAGAWIISVGLFAAAHVAGFLGTYGPLELLLSFLLYLPAGAVLCFTYRRSGSIIAPMMTHAIVNLMAVYSQTR